MPHLPCIRPVDKSLLVSWIEIVSCHQRTNCSSGLAPSPWFVVASLPTALLEHLMAAA